jgi:WD40 repeat protein
MKFSPDSQFFALAEVDSPQETAVKLWELATGEEPYQLVGHTKRVTQLVFTPDGKALLSASADEMVKLWVLSSVGE